MFSKQDLLGAFTTVDEISEAHYFFQHSLPQAVYQYCLKSLQDKDLLTVSEDILYRDFSMAVLDKAPDFLSSVKPSVYTITDNVYGFTHAMAVPSSYHSCLKGSLEITNYAGDVLEVVSPKKDVYMLIRNRKDEEPLTFPQLAKALFEFSHT